MKERIKAIRNNFILFGIKIKDFCKGHKIASGALSLLLVSTIVISIIVSATEDSSVDNATVSSASFVVNTDDRLSPISLQNGKALNFSTIYYNLQYRLTKDNICNTEDTGEVKNVDKLTITAIVPATANAVWNNTDETTSSVVSDAGKKLTVYIEDAPLCSSPQQVLPLTILNADQSGEEIVPTLKIKAGTNGTETTIDNTNAKITTAAPNGEITLKSKIQSGIIKNGVGKFGIALGFDKDQLVDGDLTGKYVKGENEIFLSAKQGNTEIAFEEGVNATEDDATTNSNFGTYFASKKLFFPHLMPELSTSGYAKSLTANTKSVPNGNSIRANATFYGTNNLKYDHIDNSTSLLLDNIYIKSGTDYVKCTTNGTICSIDSNGVTQGSAPGNYKIIYKLNQNGYVTKYERNVTIVSSETPFVGPKEVTYFLDDAKATTNNPIEKIVNDNSTAKLCKKENENYICYTDGEDPEQTYPITVDGVGTYYVLKGDSDNDDNNNPIITKINVVENDSYEDLTKSSINKEMPSKVIITKGSTYNVCTGVDGCTVVETDLDTNAVGEYTATIKLSENGISFTYEMQIEVQDLFYKLLLDKVQYNGELTLITAKDTTDKDMYALGTYFVTTKAITVGGSNLCVSASANESGVKDNLCISTITSATGSNTMSNKAYVEEDGEMVLVDSSDKTTLNDRYYTAALGEEIEQEVIFNYGYDAASSLSELTIEVPINKTYIDPIAYGDTIVDAPIYENFFLVDRLNDAETEAEAEQLTGLTKTITYYSGATTYTPGTDSYSNVDKIVIKIQKTNFLTPGSSIRFRMKYKVKENIGNVNNGFYFDSVTAKSGATSLQISNRSETVFVTPYKLRSITKFGKFDVEEDQTTVLREVNELTFDASKNDTYTGAVFLSVIAPTLNTSTVLGYTAVNSIPVKITLPRGINYVYNKTYVEVVANVNYNNDGTTTITYNYSGVEPNSWIEPLYFDFNIDVTTETSILDIVVETGDLTTQDSTNDISSNNYKRTTHRLNIQNTYDVAYGQYLYDINNSHYVSNIDKNEGFIQSLKIKNNSLNTASNVYLYAIVPNEISSNKTNFSGSFNIEFPTNNDELKCTTTDPSNLTKDEFVRRIGNDASVWSDCNSIDMSKITGYRIKYNSVAQGESKVANAKYTINDNSPADVYEFDSYVTYQIPSTSTNTGYTATSNTYIPFHSVSLEVISKKITGIVFEDFIVNGIKDGNEKTIEGVVLKLYKEDGTLVKTETSSKNGVYTFSGLDQGKYYITAEYNTEKYGLTTQPSVDFYDKTRMSVFKESGASSTQEENNSTNDEDASSELTTQHSPVSFPKTDIIDITSETRTYNYVNLGLAPRKAFQAKITKYVSKAVVTDALGVQTIKDYNNAKIAKLDVRDLSKSKIKVIYNFEIQNVKYYPGYVKRIIEMIPEGMSFNKDYAENKGWVLTEDGTLENTTLANTLLNENDKKYLTVAFDITSTEAGSFVNIASIDELQIYGGETGE